MQAGHEASNYSQLNFLYTIDRGKVKNKAHDVNQSQGPAGNTELIVLH